MRDKKILPTAIVWGCLAALIVMATWLVLSSHTPATVIARTAPPIPAASPTEQIVQLPEDGQAYYVSVFVHEDWRARNRERSLLGWWRLHPRLASLSVQTHYNVYTTADPHYKSTFASTITELPAILVQQADGKVLYKASGGNLPDNVEALASDVTQFCDRGQGCRPFRDRNKPNPEPKPDTQPDVQPIPDQRPIDDVAPSPAPPWALAAGVGLLCFFGALGVGLIAQVVREVKGR